MMYYARVTKAFCIIGACGSCAGNRSATAIGWSHYKEKSGMIQGKFWKTIFGSVCFCWEKDMKMSFCTKRNGECLKIIITFWILIE